MADEPALDELQPGTALQSGHYVLGDTLGRGGFGITYEAHDTLLDRAIAVKEFFPQGARRAGGAVATDTVGAADFAAARDTFLDEARTLARFQHPHIVPVYGAFTENDTAYMVMQLLRGRTLQEAVDSGGALTPELAQMALDPVCSALEAIHDAGLLHGDVKPANIMLAQGSAAGSTNIVLLDFGLTRRIEPHRYATVRLAPVRVGSEGYAPIEQYARQAMLGVRSDIYALAATLYFALSGSTPPEAVDRASGFALPDVRAINPAVSHVLAGLIESGMAIDAAARPGSIAEFRALLAEAASQPEAEPEPARFADSSALVAPLQPDNGWMSPQPNTLEDEPAAAWQTQTIYGPKGIQPRPTQRRPAPDPFRFDTPGSSLFIGPGCPGGCACGCLGLFGVLMLILSFFGSLLHQVGWLLTGQ